MSAQSMSERRVDLLKQILLEYPGSCPVTLHVGDIQLALGSQFTVDIDKVIGPLRMEFGPKVVSF
jgi:hypothetical protein